MNPKKHTILFSEQIDVTTLHIIQIIKKTKKTEMFLKAKKILKPKNKDKKKKIRQKKQKRTRKNNIISPTYLTPLVSIV